MPTPPSAQPPPYAIRAIWRFDKAIDFLHSVYAEDPSFGALIGAQGASDLDASRLTFESIIHATKSAPGLLLGSFDGPRLVGTLAFYPDWKLTTRQIALRAPLQLARAVFEHRMRRRRQRRVLPPHVLERECRYMGLVGSGNRPVLSVMALAVAPSARRRGVASALLDAMAADERFEGISQIELSTWDPAKVRIYERMGFRVESTAHAGDITCWTLCRPMDRPTKEAAPAPDTAAAARARRRARLRR